MTSLSSSGSLPLLPARKLRERRNARRLSADSRPVQVELESREGIAHCRDISATGMKLNLAVPLKADESIAIVLSPSLTLRGRVAWLKGNECGIEFDQPLDRTMLASGTTLPSMRGGSGRESGALRTRDGHFNPGLNVKLVLQSGREQPAVLRWTKDNIAELTLLPLR